jgi:hypothetical protein
LLCIQKYLNANDKKKGLESNLKFTFYVICQAYNVGDPGFTRLLYYVSAFNRFVDFFDIRNDFVYGWLITSDMP